MDSTTILEALAAEAPQEPKQARTVKTKFDVKAWLEKNGVKISRIDAYHGGERLILESCVFNPDHKGTSVAVIVGADGAIGYACQHNGCADKHWGDVRELFEPGYREHKQSKVNDDGSPKVFPYTDMGNAERLFAKFGKDFHWVTERKLFIYWNGHTWVYDTPDETYMMKLAKATIRDIANEPDGSGKDGFKDKLKHALLSESSKRQRDMIALAKSEGNTTISVKELDSDIYLFNCKNATIDLRTGKAREQCREDLITITAPVEYDETATCPNWDGFLNVILDKNQGMITYLQTLCGYCLTGDTKTDIVPFCHGPGGNGKSTFWGVIRDDIMGDYAYEVDPDVFLVNIHKFKDSGQREELVNLYGKRLVTATEIQEGRQLTINLLKAISGGEAIHGDRKYERGMTFKATFKVILSGNNEPIIKDTTDGAWRRLKKLPFIVKIKNPIDGYEAVFKNELPGILNWLIQGCLRWQAEGLIDPQEVVDATADYRKNQDYIAQFLDDCCIRAADNEVSKKSFRTAYLAWCSESSIKPLGDTELKKRLAVFNISEKRTNSARFWVGVHLLTLSDSVTASDSKILKPIHEGKKLEKSKENLDTPVTFEANSDRMAEVLGMPVTEALDLWRKEGAPIIRLDQCSNCLDLEIFLQHENIKPEHLEAIAVWLREHSEGAS